MKCRTICDNNSFKTYLKVCHTCHARQKRIEINMKLQNTSRGILENPFKSQLESFIEVDVKSSTVIPPNSKTLVLISTFAGMSNIDIQCKSDYQHDAKF